MEDSIKYLNYVANNYDNIKNCIDMESIKTFGCIADEDIFHDTLIKCLNASDKLKNDNQIKNYIFISYKTNYKREQEYARNKNRDDNDVIIYDHSENDNTLLDYNTIKNIIVDRFGENEWRLFEEFIYGCSISEISKDNHESGLYYRFNKIREYAKKIITK